MKSNVVAKRLVYKNSWENDEYYVDGKKIKTLYSVMINGKDYVVSFKPVAVSYDDMGHTYSSTSRHYFITEEVFGVQRSFDLNTVVNKVKVFAIGYDFE